MVLSREEVKSLLGNEPEGIICNSFLFVQSLGERTDLNGASVIKVKRQEENFETCLLIIFLLFDFLTRVKSYRSVDQIAMSQKVNEAMRCKGLTL